MFIQKPQRPATSGEHCLASSASYRFFTSGGAPHAARFFPAEARGLIDGSGRLELHGKGLEDIRRSARPKPVREWPTPAQLESLHFREENAGANAWLVLPNDDGVFTGATTVEGIPAVHPVQVYVDLKGHPERAPEAAEHLRECADVPS